MKNTSAWVVRFRILRIVSSTRWMLLLWAGCALAFGTTDASAQNYPTRAVNLIIGQPPGGGTDFVTRVVGAKLAEKWGQPVIVENRPGAGGIIAADFIARAEPDGYKLLAISSSHTTPALDNKPNYDPIKSFSSIAEMGAAPYSFVVNLTLPVNSLREFISFAKARPGQLNFGDSGKVTVAYWAMSFFMNLTGTEMTHVPFKGSGPAMIAQLGNEIQVTLSLIPVHLTQVKAGKLKALAVTGKDRLHLLPEVPTFFEASGLRDFEGIVGFYGFMAPPGTPKNIVNKLNNDIVEVVRSPDVQASLISQGVVAATAKTPEEFTRFLTNDIARWTALQKTMNIK